MTAADVMKLTTATTVASKPIKIAVKDGKVMIDDATVVSADIHCTNGVIRHLAKLVDLLARATAFLSQRAPSKDLQLLRRKAFAERSLLRIRRKR